MAVVTKNKPTNPRQTTPAKMEKTEGFTEVPAGEGKKNRKKKDKVKRTAFGDRDDKGKLKTPIKGNVTPDGYDPKLHLPLKTRDFENPADALEWQADRLEARVVALRKEAQEERKLGDPEKRKAVKQMKGLMARFKKMEAAFKDEGMTDEDIAKFLNG